MDMVSLSIWFTGAIQGLRATLRVVKKIGGDERIRTADRGFADPRLNHLATSPGAEDGIRTRDPHLGKVMLYR